MKIEVYADVVCPWCYIGERRLGRALEGRPEEDVELGWHPFQLRPEMPAGGMPWREFVLEKFGGGENMRRSFAHVEAAGVVNGARFDFDRVANAPNTVEAHRLILYAAEHAKEWEMAGALFRGYFAQGRDLNNIEDLATMAAEAGLDAQGARHFLASDAGTQAVWDAQRAATDIGINGVPFYVIDGRYAVSGAQPVEVWLRAFDAIGAEKGP